MASLEETFEGSTDGDEIDLTNTIFDLEAGLSSTSLFDDDLPPLYGSMDGLWTVTSGNTRSFAWTTSWHSDTEVWYRWYMYPIQRPTSTTTLAQWGIGTPNGCDIRMTSTGTIQFRSGELVAIFTSSALANNQWHRIEGRVLHSDTVGRMQARIFTNGNVHGTTPDQTLGDTTTNRDTDASSDRFSFGVTTNPGALGLTAHFKGVKIDDTGWIGPAVVAGSRKVDRIIQSRSNLNNAIFY